MTDINLNIVDHAQIETFGGIYKDKKSVCLTIVDVDQGVKIGLPIPINQAIDLGQELIRLGYATMYKEVEE